MKESGLRENCTIRLIERTEGGVSRPPSTLHASTGRRKAEGPNVNSRMNQTLSRNDVMNAEFPSGTALGE